MSGDQPSHPASGPPAMGEPPPPAPDPAGVTAPFSAGTGEFGPTLTDPPSVTAPFPAGAGEFGPTLTADAPGVRTDAIIAPPPDQRTRAQADQGSAPAPAWPVIHPPRRSRSRWLVPLLLMAIAAALVGYILHRRSPSPTTPLQVTAVTASAPAAVGCDATVPVSGMITTNGGEGTLTYMWSRSDGQQTANQRLSASPGQTSYPVSLLWSISGRGRLLATATLKVVSPTAPPAEASFSYSC